MTPSERQLPGFNTFEVDANLIPKSLVMTSLDITKVYGMTSLPPVDSIPRHTLDFEK